MSEFQYILNSVLGIWSIIIVVIGTIGNAICFAICFRKKLREIPTFIFLAFMVFSDIISLYGWIVNHFLRSQFGFVLLDLCEFMCKGVPVWQFISLQSSSWLLVRSLNKSKVI